jgi:diacylglycerol kinase family enzyme
MHFSAVLNRDGGTLRTTDIENFSGFMRHTLKEAGHKIDIEAVSGDEIADALDRALASESDVVLAGGGDGTISAAATRLMGTDKALAILPAGTMNLFARGLKIPQTLEAAVAAFADGRVMPVDMATANDEAFIHQFSFGMHAKMVQLRSRMEFGSRFGKMHASAKAAWSTIMNPPSMKVALTINGKEQLVRTSGIGVSNNVFGEGHLPYADEPDGGVLGIYLMVARERGEMIRLAFNLARGKWRDNEHVEVLEAEEVTVKIVSFRGKRAAVMDGELVKLAEETKLKIHPRALNALVPREA